MKKLVLFLLLVSGGLTMMSIAPVQVISGPAPDGEVRCRQNAGSGPPFFKRHCNPCQTFFSNYSTRGNCSKS